MSKSRQNKLLRLQALRSMRRASPLETRYPDDNPDRPRVRRDCENGPRPCPWIGCKHNLYLSVDDNGSLLLNFPDLEPGEMKESCILDCVDRDGAMTLAAIGERMNVTRERIRQIETRAKRMMSQLDDLKERA